MKNIDKYLLGEMSEDFVIDSAEREEYAGHSQENQLTGNQNIQLIEPLSDSIDGNLLERINDELKEHKSRPEKFDLLEFEEIPDGPSEDEERIKSMENNSLI